MAELLGKISNLAIYPIKSGGMLEVKSALLTPAGLKTPDGVKDHGLIVVRGTPRDGYHDFVTQRDKRNPRDRDERPQSFAELARIKPSLVEGGLTFSWIDSNEIAVPLDAANGEVVPVRVWDYESEAVEVPTLSKWASDNLNYGVKVVATEGPWNRMSDHDYMPNDNPLWGQDGYPVHWFTQASLDELSGVAGQEIPWTRFRPQVVIEGAEPRAEHLVFNGLIAGIEFSEPKPCGRCTIPRVDQVTGEVTKLNPLTALNQFRQWRDQDGDKKVIFGENMLPHGTGLVTVGDEVVSTARRNPPLTYGAKI